MVDGKVAEPFLIHKGIKIGKETNGYHIDLKLWDIKLKDIMIKSLFNRLLIRIFWFYENIINERDDFMKFYYTVFAFSMFIVFYLWGGIIFLERTMDIDLLEYNKIKYFSFAVLITGAFMYFFWRNRAKWERIFKKKELSFNLYDVGVISYIFFSFFAFFYNLLKS